MNDPFFVDVEQATSGTLIVELIDSAHIVVEQTLNIYTTPARIVKECFNFDPWLKQGINVYLDGEMVATTEL